ncbi:LOW QUALITY PROTEIN: scavenger receptor cysteine-rich type 1 protein M130-like [Eudromia elegans]
MDVVFFTQAGFGYQEHCGGGCGCSYESNCGSCEGQTGGKMGKGDPAVKRGNLHSNPLLTRKSDPAPILASTVMRKEQGKKLQTETAHARYKLESRPRKPPGAPVKPRQEEERRGPHCLERFPAIQETSPEKVRKGSRKESTVPLPPLEKAENRVEKWLEEVLQRRSLSNQTCSHANDAGVTCTRFRLVNGSTSCSGRVEIEVEGTWGTLCDSGWDIPDAHVLCHQLNCGFAESVPAGGHYGRGTGPVWRDTFHCNGTESHLGQCPVTALGVSPCSPDNNAGVVCSGHSGSLRLVSGGSHCDGRVEMALNGTWRRVLDEQWDLNDASVVCRQLQCGEAEQAYNPLKPEGTGPVGLRRVQCAGKETRLTLCNTSLPLAVPAGIAEDVGVVCSGSRQVRLVHRAGRCAGRVEIYYKGTWGTVCDDSWDLLDATVVCRQLGCGVAVNFTGSAHHGEGSGQIWLDDVNCSGDEVALWDCPARPWGQHNCRHKEDAGVICSEFMALRLENSDGCSGRLQVFYNGTWGSVCSDWMLTHTASIVCKQLGCGDEGSIETPEQKGKISGTAWLDRVECDPTQRRVRESGAVSVPVVICSVLGALLCLLLALLAWHVRSARAQHRASRRSLDPFSEAVYQEIDYSQVWEEQERLGPPGSSSEGSLTKLQRKPRDSEEEEHPGSAPEVPVLPRGDPADGYDDAREVSDPGEDLVPAQRDWEAPREAEEGDGLEEAQRDTAYDDAEGVSLTHPPEDTKAVRLKPGAKQSLNPGLGEPITAMRLGAAGTEERSVHLGET